MRLRRLRFAPTIALFFSASTRNRRDRGCRSAGAGSQLSDPMWRRDGGGAATGRHARGRAGRNRAAAAGLERMELASMFAAPAWLRDFGVGHRRTAKPTRHHPSWVSRAAPGAGIIRR